MPFCLFKTPQPSISLFFILIYSITILIKYTLTKCENNIFRKISKIFNSNPLSATMVWQGVWCDFGLILCKNSLKLHKNKNFCISDFSKNLTFLTNLANILNFICQICKFFKQSSPTSQPSVAHRFIKILKSHTSICKTKSTPFLACTVFILPLQECRAYTAVHHNRVWVPRPFRHSERSVGIQPSGAIATDT